MAEEGASNQPGEREKLDHIESEHDEETQKKKQKSHLSWSLFWQVWCVVCIAVNMASVGLKLSGATYAQGFVALVVSIIVFVRQFQLRDSDALRNTQNDIRHEVNRFQEENNVLHSEVDKLTENVDRLKATESKLDAMAKQQGSNVAALVGLAKENGEILAEMQKATRSETLQSLFDVVLYADVDQDFTIGKDELPELLLKLGNDTRVKMDQKLLIQTVKNSGYKLPVLELVDDLMSAPNAPDGKHIFWFPPKKHPDGDGDEDDDENSHEEAKGQH